MLNYIEHDNVIMDEIDNSVKSTIKNGFNSNHSMASGSLGNIDLLLSYQNKYEKNNLNIDKIIDDILEEIELTGYKTNNLLHLKSFGLFNGLPGIGYQLLRILKPKEVPSILTLDTIQLE